MSPLLVLLRQLAEQQQFLALQAQAEEAWFNERDVAYLPLIALAHAHLDHKAIAENWLQLAQQQQAKFDAYALTDLAAVLILMMRFEAAEELLIKALEMQPNHTLAIARQGYCAMMLGEPEKAQQYYEQALMLEPYRVSILVNLALLHLNNQNYDLVEQILENAAQQLEQQPIDLSEAQENLYLNLIRSVQLRLWIVTEQSELAEGWLRLQQDQSEESNWFPWVKQYVNQLAEIDQHISATEYLREQLKSHQENSSLCILLAELQLVQGHFMQAINLLRRAVRWDKDNPSLWIQLSGASLRRLDKQARKAAEKAVALTHQLEENDDYSAQTVAHLRAQAKNALAQVENHEENVEQSEKLFKEILIDFPYFTPALQSLAQQYMHQGKIDDAIGLFERIKEVDPLRGYSALINARQFPEDEETLHKMEFAAQRPSLEGKMRSGILFQLASAWEKRKNYDKAFELAQQANRASRKFLPYDGQKHRNNCARIRARFSKALYEHRTACGVNSTLPVYVLGMPRSGTTLIEQILSGHSDIFGAGELGVIPQVAQGLRRWEKHAGSGRSYPDCVDDLTPHITQGIANNVLKELQEYAPDAKHVVDKLPHNFENIGLIKFLFPKAKIISVRRDPRDIAMSNFFTDYQAKHGGMGFAYDLEDIGQQLADHNLLMHHWHQTFPGEILEINYEDVVEDLEGSARKMLNYIGVDWQPEVLKFNELERTVKTASVWQVRQPIYKTSKAKWMRYQQYLAPLIKGTNAKIESNPISDMLSLPEPGFLTKGVDLYRQGDLDGAELSFKKMLHHNPNHAACTYMIGLIYLQKEHTQAGIEFIEKAVEKAPWHQEWKQNLLKAYEFTGEVNKAQALQSKLDKKHKVSKVKEASDETQKELFDFDDKMLQFMTSNDSASL